MKKRIGVVVMMMLTGIVVGCGGWGRPTPTPVSLEQLMAMVEAANPDLPGWDRVDFWFAAEELERLGPAAAPAAPVLARALQYRRRDSYVVTKALVAMGPAAAPAIPELVKALRNERAIVRSNAAFVLGSIGEPARCAVPAIALLLWDSEPGVPSEAARALEAITGVDLLAKAYEFDPETLGSAGGDKRNGKPPNGKLVRGARIWWLVEGRHLDWSGEPNLCDASSP